MTAALAIMAKAPVPGLCKTRLARNLGAERAADLYRHFLLDTIDLARRVPGVTVSTVCPDAEHARLLREILPPDVAVDTQEGEGLLAGLASAFALHFARGCERVALLDGDSPTLPPRHVAAALDRLADHDLVLGPCDDGGYYLIAARALYPSLFFGVTYRGESICDEKVRRAGALGLAVTLVDPWYDVDTDEDYRRLLADLRSDESLARHTRGHLGMSP